MSRVKEYLALIPIVGSKYDYQRGGEWEFLNFLGNIKTLGTQQRNE